MKKCARFVMNTFQKNLIKIKQFIYFAKSLYVKKALKMWEKFGFLTGSIWSQVYLYVYNIHSHAKEDFLIGLEKVSIERLIKVQYVSKSGEKIAVLIR